MNTWSLKSNIPDVYALVRRAWGAARYEVLLTAPSPENLQRKMLTMLTDGAASSSSEYFYSTVMLEGGSELRMLIQTDASRFKDSPATASAAEELGALLTVAARGGK